MARVHGEGVTHMDVWMRMCMLMAFKQLHFIPDPIAQTKQHLQDLVPRRSRLAHLPQHHSPRPSGSTLLGVSSHIPPGGAGKGGQSQAWWEGVPLATQEGGSHHSMPGVTVLSMGWTQRLLQGP